LSGALDAALGYAERGWPIFPMSATKRPLTGHGVLDATVDAAQIREWFTRWPGALAAMATGERSGIVAVDIDVRPDVNGFDTLAELGIDFHPGTPTAHSPSGGCHVLFAWPGHFVKTAAGQLGRGLDIRGDGGSLILPPGPRRFWDPHLHSDSTPLAPLPAWAVIKDQVEQPKSAQRSRPVGSLSRYGEAALDNAVKRIIEAPSGEQETTLNASAYGIGQLSGGGVIPAGLALDALLWAARRMPSFDSRRPWRPVDLERKVKSAFTDGLREPRTVPNG